MLRARLALVVAIGSLGLTCGCASFCNHPWFNRHRSSGPECIDLGVVSVSEGPVLESGPIMAPTNGMPPASTLVPQATVPPLNAPPRLVPQPQQQSQPTPYMPTVR